MAGPRGLAAAALAALALAACGEKPEPDLSSIPAPKASAEPSQLTITARGDREAVVYAVDGTARAGTVRVTLRNESELRVNGRMVRVDGERSTAAVAAELDHLQNGKPIAEWFHDADGPPLTPPGESTTTTLELSAGTHYVVGDQPISDRPATIRIEP